MQYECSIASRHIYSLSVESSKVGLNIQLCGKNAKLQSSKLSAAAPQNAFGNCRAIKALQPYIAFFVPIMGWQLISFDNNLLPSIQRQINVPQAFSMYGLLHSLVCSIMATISRDSYKRLEPKSMNPIFLGEMVN